jgi:hypothetical protein
MGCLYQSSLGHQVYLSVAEVTYSFQNSRAPTNKFAFPICFTQWWLYIDCYNFLQVSSFSRSHQIDSVYWNMLFLCLEKEMVQSGCLEFIPYHFCLHYIGPDKSYVHMSMTDRVADKYTPPAQRYYGSPGNGLGCIITS